MGNFNMPHVCWSFDHLCLIAIKLTAASSHLIDSFSCLNHFQLNGICNQLGRILDLIFSNTNEPLVYTIAFPIVPLITPYQLNIHSNPKFIITTHILSMTLSMKTTLRFLNF